MPRRIDYQVGFSADTNQLKKQLEDVKRSLADVASLSTGKASVEGNLSKELVQASLAAENLRIKLLSAIDVDTGKLDLTKFRRSIEESGMSLEEYKNQLSTLGVQGERTFLKMTQAISNAEQPTLRLTGLMSKLATTFANTIRWQISTQALMAFTGSIQTAYTYAQNLNESLNNIRIVTGQSTNQMADFAKYANEAASRLSTTTVEYTDAALIFYQQGLGDEAVRERTDATIKLAEVTGQSVETVSSQLTAIWNNFDNGTKSLEYYADVLTKLGATTASSSDEIAQGVEKFAATAQTIGLSYEYSAAALATLTATTRQSADVVGTSLRTIFARFESLSLGETLEDDVTLNKYTEALKTVGVEVIDASGNLREMNDILDDTMHAWNNLTEAQQVALATTVAGVRQYTSFIALMNNQDFFKQNVETARTSEGTLQEQADIYAESWEAARDRVVAAAEDVYDSLIDENLFMDLAKLEEGFLKNLAKIIDGLGGMKGVLNAIATLMVSVFSDKIGSAAIGLANFVGIARGATQARNAEFQENARRLSSSIDTSLLTPEAQGLQKQLEIEQEIAKVRDKAPQVYLDLLESNKTIIGDLTKQKALHEDNLKALSEQIALLENKHKLSNSSTLYKDKDKKNIIVEGEALSSLRIKNYSSDLLGKASKVSDAQVYISQLKNLEKGTDAYNSKLNTLKQLLKEVGINLDEAFDPSQPEQVSKVIDPLNIEIQNGIEKLNSWAIALEKGGHPTIAKKVRGIAEEFSNLENEVQKTSSHLDEFNERLGERTTSVKQLIEDSGKQTLTMSQGIGTLVSSLTQATFILNQAKSAAQQWGDVIRGDGDIISALTSTMMTLTTVIALYNNLSTDTVKRSAAKLLALIAEKAGWEGVATAATKAAIATKAGAGPIWVIIAAIAALVVIIYAVVKAYKAWQDSLHQEEIALEKAKAKVEELKTAYEDAKSAYDNLVSDKSNYENLLNNLNELKQGTDEFKKALEETNEAARKLLDEHPELYSKAKYNEKGAITFEPDTLKELQNQFSNQLLATSIAKYVAQQEVINRQQDVVIKNTQYKASSVSELIFKNEDFGKLINQIWTNNNKDYAYGALQVDLQHFIDKTVVLNKENLSEFLNNYNVTSDSLISQIYNAIKETQDLERVLSQNSEEISHLDNFIANELINDYVSRIGAELSDQERQFLVNQVVIALQNDPTLKNGLTAWTNEDLDPSKVVSEDTYKRYKTGKSKQGTRKLIAAKDPQYEEKLTAIRAFAYNNSIDYLETDTYAQIYKKLQKFFNELDIIQGISQYRAYNFNEVIEPEINKEDQIKQAIKKAGLEEVSDQIFGAINTGAFDMSQLSEDQVNLIKKHWQEFFDYFNFEARDSRRSWFYLTDTLTDDFSAFYENQRNQIKKNASLLESVYDTLSSGKDFEENSEEAEYFKNLKVRYKDLAEAEEKYGLESYEFRRALRIATKKEEIDILNDLMANNADNKTILIQWFKQIEESRDRVFDSLQDYFDLGNLIPEDLTISVAEAQNLIKQGYSDILEKSEITADGQIALNEEVTTAYLQQLENRYQGELDFQIKQLTIEKEILEDQLKNFRSKNTAQKISYLASIKGFEEIGKASDESTETVLKGQDKEHKGFLQLIDDVTALWETIRTGSHTTPLKLDFIDIEGNLGKRGSSLSDKARKNIESILNQVEEYWQSRIDDINLTLDILNKSKNTSPITAWIDRVKEASNASSKANQKLIDQLKDILERYHKISREIEYQEYLLNKYSKAADRAYGKARLDGLAKQEAILTAQIANLESKLSAVQLNGIADLEAVQKLTGIEVKIDKESLDIINYSDILNDAYEKYQKAVQHYETLSDKDKEAYEETLNTMKEGYTALKEALDQYEETVDLARDLKEEIIDKQFTLADLGLEKLTYKLELIFDVKENEDAINNFGKKLAESFGDYLTHGQKSLDFAAMLEASNEALLPHLAGLDGVSGQWYELIEMYNRADDAIDRAQIVEELKSVRDQIYSTLEAMLDYINTLENALPEAVDAARARFDAMINQLSHSKTIYNSIKQLYELQGVTNSTYEGYIKLREISQKSLEAEVTNARLQREWYENAYSRLMDAEAALERVQEGDDAYDLLKNARDALLEEYNSAQEAMLQSAISAMQIARDIFTQAIDKAKDDFSNALSDGLGLDWLEDKYNRYIDQEERYLDLVNEEYEVNKWNRKLQEAIDSAKSAGAIAKLKELKDEIEMRRANNTLSKYDLEILEAKYEMTMKQIALEEAQNSATQMRLQRDAQGNWNYVYTADYDEVAKAQQAYDDAVNDYYNIAKKQVKDVTQEILDTWQECADRIAEIYQDETLTVEEREQMIAEIREYYAEKIRALEEEKNQAIKDMTEAGGIVIDDFANKYGEDMDKMTEAARNFDELFEEYLRQAEEAAREYESTIDQVATDTGTSLDDLQEHMQQATEAADRLKLQGAEAIDYIWNKIPRINEVTESYQRQIEKIYDLIRAYEALLAAESRKTWNQSNWEPVEEVYTPTEGTDNEIDPDDWPWFEDGGYTGNFRGAKPAMLHGQEYVLNKDDTQNILGAAALTRSLDSNIISNLIRMLNNNALISRDSLGSAFSISGIGGSIDRVIQQSVAIEATFPGVSSAIEIETAMRNLVNQAVQYTELKE